MAAEATKTSSDDKSIKDIVNIIISDDSSPISSWLINVIETYLNNTQKIEALTMDKLYSLTNDMLLTYSIATTQTESKQICLKLIELLQANNHLPQFNEPFPVNTKCVAMYNDDNEWYPATVIDIIQSGYLYLVEFDGYGNKQNVSIHEIQSIETEENDKNDTISLKDSINKKTEKKDVNLEKMIINDMVTNDECLKKKKYVNDLIKIHEVNEEKLNLMINESEEKEFSIFIDGKEKDDINEMNENDVEKYTVGNGKNKRRINPKNDICCICLRLLPLTWHHLIPKCTHNEYIKSHPNSSKLFLNKHGIWICRQCHSAIHGIYTNKELMKSYCNLEMLLQSEKVEKWIKYVSKQKVTAKYDNRVKTTNRIANIQRDKNDHSTKIKYIQ